MGCASGRKKPARSRTIGLPDGHGQVILELDRTILLGRAKSGPHAAGLSLDARADDRASLRVSGDPRIPGVGRAGRIAPARVLLVPAPVADLPHGGGLDQEA